MCYFIVLPTPDFFFKYFSSLLVSPVKYTVECLVNCIQILSHPDWSNCKRLFYNRHGKYTALRNWLNLRFSSDGWWREKILAWFLLSREVLSLTLKLFSSYCLNFSDKDRLELVGSLNLFFLQQLFSIPPKKHNSLYFWQRNWEKRE